MERDAYREQFELEDTHWWFEGRRAVIRALLARTATATDAGSHAGSSRSAAPNGSGLRVLDAGCGTGRNMIELAALGTVRGIDSSPEALELCRSRGITDVRQGRVEQLPFDDGSFDLVVATDVIEHLLDDRAALRELRRVCAPGARLLATVPAYGWLWSAHDNDHHHYRRYTLRQLRARVEQAGFQTVAASYFNSLLLPPIAVVRLLQARRPVAPDARPDLELTPRALNRLLEQPLRLEAALIERGVSLPAGVSIGLVAVAGGTR